MLDKIIMPIIHASGKAIQAIPMVYWIGTYILLAALCSIYLIIDRRKKLRDRTLYLSSFANTKRAKAIEQFQSYNSQLADLCTDVPGNNELDSEPISGPGIFINPAVRPTILSMASVATQDGYNQAQILLENYLYTADSKISMFVDQIREKLTTIIQATNRNTQYNQEIELDTELDTLPTQIKQLISALDTEFMNSLTDEQSDLFTIETADTRANKANQLDIEIRERLFAGFARDKAKVARQVCSQRTRVKEAQAAYDSKTRAGENNSQPLDAAKQSLSDWEAKFKGYLFILSRLATTNEAIETLKKEMEAVSTVLIQPINESQLDGLGLIKQNLASRASINDIGNPITSKKAELDLSRQYSGAYQDYLDNMAEQSTKLDPIAIISDTEEATLDFLTRLNSKLSNKQPATVPLSESVFSVPNRFSPGNQPYNLGDKLIANNGSGSGSIPIPMMANSTSSPLTNSGINQLIASTSDGATNTKEGFQDVPKTDSKGNGTIDGFIKYAYDTLSGFLDKETADKLKALFQEDDTMIPLGTLLIVSAIILFFAGQGD
jgi:hypothetical protein